jgi:hypothetical protein
VKHAFLLLLLLQILGRCIASANSPIDTVRKGVQHWLDLGVPARKLVLGLPWYGEHTQHRYGRLKLDSCRLLFLHSVSQPDGSFCNWQLLWWRSLKGVCLD